MALLSLLLSTLLLLCLGDSMREEALIDYDLGTYPFVDIVSSMYFAEEDSTRELAKLHEKETDKPALVMMKDDQKLPQIKAYYSSPQLALMLQTYESFIKEVIAPMFDDEAIVYQKKPTFRVHLPDNVSLPYDEGGDESRPGLHCDSDYKHGANEINFWVPLTDTIDANTIHVESQPGAGDFHPVLAKAGQMFRFYGSGCRHFNKVNTTGKTRVSFDFRVVPFSQWVELEDPPVTTHGRRLKMGDGEEDYFTLYRKIVPVRATDGDL